MEEIWLPKIDATICTGCGDCIPNCPTDALAMVENVAMLARPAACNYCSDCESVCPVGAISVPFLIVLEPAV
jgi:ferredoxin